MRKTIFSILAFIAKNCPNNKLFVTNLENAYSANSNSNVSAHFIIICAQRCYLRQRNYTVLKLSLKTDNGNSQ